MTLGAALAQGDAALAGPLLHASEFLGLPIGWGSKRYLFGVLPVGDAFLAWSKTARPWIAPPGALDLPPVVRWWWRLPAHALSLVLVVVVWLPGRRKKSGLSC